MQARRIDRGSALVEAAVILPCLVLILCWSAALTDLLVLRLKGAEAVRYALWETTVFKQQPQIDRELRARFADLRSPSMLEGRQTGLLLYPRAADLLWSAEVDTTTHEVPLGGSLRLPPGSGSLPFLGSVIGSLSGSVDVALRRQRFNVYGKAVARVVLSRAGRDPSSPLLRGGGLPGLRGGRDLAAPPSIESLSFQTPLPSARPMELVFDTWKAWPRPGGAELHGSPTDMAVSPMRTYPVVEEQVSSQVGEVAFFGFGQSAASRALRKLTSRFAQSGISAAVFGARLPGVVSSARMDGPDRGPVTILPPEKADVPWVPHDCGGASCATQRAGDVRSDSTAPRLLHDDATMGDSVDRTRYTLPYRINTAYWTEPGGTVRDGTGARLAAPARALAEDNEYVRSYRCRGHWFAGSMRPQEPHRDRRHGPGCP